MSLGRSRWVLLGSSTCNWNYHFRNKACVLAPSRSGYKYFYSSCVGEGVKSRGVREVGPAQVQGVRCFPALMASQLWKLP